MPSRLRSLAACNLQPRVIFDIGAATGEWARLAHQVWPAATIVGFEPNQSRIEALERTRAEVPGFSFHRCFLGAKASEDVAYADDQEQTSLFATSGRASATAPMRTLDGMLAANQIPQPDLLKLDVQGYELEALSGGARAMASASAAILEVSLYAFAPGVPTLDRVLSFMRERGFVAYDLAGILRRPKDDRLAQLDVVFLKEGHELLADVTWA